MRTVIFVSVSRPNIIKKLFTSLDLLECSKDTSLFVYVDTTDNQFFTEVRNLTEASKFEQSLCVQRKVKTKPPRYAISQRKWRIAAIKNESTQFILGADYVFSIEDDTIVPRHALKRLLDAYKTHPYAGLIQGAEMGRWGIPYVGAWKVDDIYDTKVFTSMMPDKGVQEIDCGGFYCYLTKYDTYTNHNYEPFDKGGMGPDVEFGLYLRQQGMRNYIDWSVKCAHYIEKTNEPITFDNTQALELQYSKDHRGRWRQHVKQEVELNVGN